MSTRARDLLLQAVLVSSVLASTCLVDVDPAQAARSAPEASRGALLVVAHRGAPSRHVTENTVAAFVRARSAGASAVEFDVRVTGDRRLLLMHDATLDRTTSCRGAAPVAELRLTWITSECRGVPGGEPIPSLTTALGWFAGNGVVPVLEMKDGGWDGTVVATLVRRVRSAGLHRRIQVISFAPRLLRLVERRAPVLETRLITRSWADVVRQQATDSAGNRLDGFSVWPRELTRERVRQLHRQGYRVTGRQANRAHQWSALHRLRVDGLVTDRVAAYRRWLRS